ncbi:Mu transposase C-terminal domain-containing protein [Phyllobacterium ifriqiyense]|uniref:Mu transposase C-terminal domain-containing protein n=1 Tax=Phyllobacterium ifriqiyense TaxID=314238 RepID=UPI003399533D
MMGAVHLLPGTTHSSVAAKGSYKAEAKAAMTLSEFDSWFPWKSAATTTAFTRASAVRPLSNERLWPRRCRATFPSTWMGLRVSFLPSEQRQVRRDGIQLFDIRYWSDALASN